MFLEAKGEPTKKRIKEFCKMKSEKILIYAGHGLDGVPMLGKDVVL